jgi:hypothetical protein
LRWKPQSAGLHSCRGRARTSTSQAENLDPTVEFQNLCLEWAIAEG